VPLPPRRRPQQQQQQLPQQDSLHKTAIIIRDGRRASQQLASLVEASKTASSSGRDVFSRASLCPSSSLRTEMEQDFTVEGKKGSLACPFSRPMPANRDSGGSGTRVGDETAGAADKAGASGSGGGDTGVEKTAVPTNTADPTPHHSADPICAAMFEEATHMPAPPSTTDANVPKCPIRYMGEHSPEEIAHYVETHKHELPRSHEICVARYQRNEEEIRKLDAKYGNIVSMIEVLSQLHKPMLPSGGQGGGVRLRDTDHASNERVESWAQEVSASAPRLEDVDKVTPADSESDRAGRFDRPLKEIRVGESPTRPWGISVPVGQAFDADKGVPPVSPPPAPVVQAGAMAGPARKCPFDHAKFAMPQGDKAQGGPPPHHAGGSPQARTAFPDPATAATPPPQPRSHRPMSYSPSPHETGNPFAAQDPQQPTFINMAPFPQMSHQGPQGFASAAAAGAGVPVAAPPQMPQMVFTGPVFFGYPVEQAMQILSQWRG
jgi:hypothetical protein